MIKSIKQRREDPEFAIMTAVIRKILDCFIKFRQAVSHLRENRKIGGSAEVKLGRKLLYHNCYFVI